MRQGLFITFEGIDGSGKSVQCQLLERRLRNAGFSVILTREPGGTPLGATIREMLLKTPAQSDAENSEIHARTEALLFAADRAQHVAQVIRPALAAGRIVVCDRFADSTRAYQGAGRRTDADAIETLIALATERLTPHLTILLDLEVAEAQRRLATRVQSSAAAASRFDKESHDFHTRVREEFLKIAATEPARFQVIDASQNPSALHEIIYAFVAQHI